MTEIGVFNPTLNGENRPTLTALPKVAQKTAEDIVAYEAVKRIGAIYHLDNQLSDLVPDDRKKQRQMTVKPLVEAFFAWVKEVGSSNRLPKGKTREGINYCINQEEALKVFLNDGEVPFDKQRNRRSAPQLLSAQTCMETDR